MNDTKIAEELLNVSKILIAKDLIEFKTAAQFVNPSVVLIDEKKFTDRELTRALRQAIAAEEEAVHLYEFIVDSTDNELAKKVLQDIANEEKVHVGELQTVLNKMLPDEQGFLNDGEEEVLEELEED